MTTRKWGPIAPNMLNIRSLYSGGHSRWVVNQHFRVIVWKKPEGYEYLVQETTENSGWETLEDTITDRDSELWAFLLALAWIESHVAKTGKSLAEVEWLQAIAKAGLLKEEESGIIFLRAGSTKFPELHKKLIEMRDTYHIIESIPYTSDYSYRLTSKGYDLCRKHGLFSQQLEPEDIYNPNTTRKVFISPNSLDEIDTVITVTGPEWWDETDWNSETTEEVISWCSENGYSYDDVEWEFVD